MPLPISITSLRHVWRVPRSDVRPTGRTTDIESTVFAYRSATFLSVTIAKINGNPPYVSIIPVHFSLPHPFPNTVFSLSLPLLSIHCEPILSLHNRHTYSCHAFRFFPCTKETVLKTVSYCFIVSVVISM